MRRIRISLRGHTASWVIMGQEEFDLMSDKMGNLEEIINRLKDHKADDRLGSTTFAQVAVLRDDLGFAMRRIEELKSELSGCRDEAERYKEEALRQIAEKKALYGRVKNS